MTINKKKYLLTGGFILLSDEAFAVLKPYRLRWNIVRRLITSGLKDYSYLCVCVDVPKRGWQLFTTVNSILRVNGLGYRDHVRIPKDNGMEVK